MALKIRQGLEALRTSFVPESGELIYTTDDKLVYVGDGVTPGGNIISSGGNDGNTTYGISAETATGGVNLRLTGSDASTDNVKFAEGANITLTRTDANTITIDATGGGGSGVIDSGLTGAVSFYAADGTTISPTGTDFTYDIGTQTVNMAVLDVDRIQTSNPIFRIINTDNDFITLGGIIDTTEYSGKLAITDIGPYDGNFPVLSSIRSVHDDANVNCLTFQRERGTLAAPTGIQQNDALGVILWTGLTDGAGDVGRAALMGVVASDPITPGSGTIPGTWFVQTTNTLGGTYTALYCDSSHDTHSVFYHYARLGLYTPQISTEDSSALTIVPQTVFNADVEIQNDLYVTNRVYANEFVSSSTGTPQIVTQQDLSLIAGSTTVTVSSSSDLLTVPSAVDTATATTDLVLGGTNAQLTINKSGGGFINLQTANGSYSFEFDANGGLVMPILGTAPASPQAGGIYMANSGSWDPLSRAGTVPYCVVWSGAAWVPINGN